MDEPTRDEPDPAALAHFGVTIAHPFGDLHVPLTEWMARGPGARFLVRPVAAWDWTTRAPVPITAIPFRYRNTTASRRWLAVTGQPSPWAHLSPDVPPAAAPRAPGWLQRIWHWLRPQRRVPSRPLLALPTAILAEGPVVGCAVSADGQLIVGAGWDAELRLWRSSTDAAPQRLPGPPGGLTSCAVSADGSTVVATGAAGAVWCWDGTTGARRHVLPGATGWVLACAVSADGAVIAATGEAGIVWVWDGWTGRLRYGLSGHDGPGVDCGVSADGAIIGSVGADGTARVWQGTTGDVQHVGMDALWGTDLTACVVDPTGQTMVVTGATVSTRVDIQTGVEQGVALELAAVCSQISADGETVVTVGEHGWVAVRDGHLEDRTHWTIADRLTGGAVAGAGRGLVISGEGGLYWYADAPAPPVPARHPAMPAAATSGDQ